MLVNWWVEKHQRFLFNVYKRFFYFCHVFYVFFNVFYFFWNVFYIYVPDEVSGSRKGSAADSGEFDRRHDQTIGGGRTEGPSTRNAGDACERCQVSRRNR